MHLLDMTRLSYLFPLSLSYNEYSSTRVPGVLTLAQRSCRRARGDSIHGYPDAEPTIRFTCLSQRCPRTSLQDQLLPALNAQEFEVAPWRACYDTQGQAAVM